MKFILEAQEPCGGAQWVRLHHPRYWDDANWTKDGPPPDDAWEAETRDDVIRQFMAAYPAYPPRPELVGAKPYRQFRVREVVETEHFEIVSVGLEAE